MMQQHPRLDARQRNPVPREIPHFLEYPLFHAGYSSEMREATVSEFLSAEGGLASLFVASFVAATLVPLSSEAVLFGFLRLYPAQLAPALMLATAGNTLGGLTSYAVGRLLPARVQAKLDARVLGTLRRYGSPLAFLAWLPLLGDALCVAAGWLRLNWIAVTAFMAAGRSIRYWVVAQAALA